MLHIRSGTDADGAALIELIGKVFAEYDGCYLDVDGEMPELRRPATRIAEEGGRFWVAERGGFIVGTISCRPAPLPGVMELKRLYVRAEERRQGLARRLVWLVEDAARETRRPVIELWSDTRFTAAHRFYERLGYHRGPERRFLHDISETWEYHYWKRVGPVPPLFR